MPIKSSDAALYRELNQPFADSEALDKATGAFFEEVAELRKKHRLPDVYVIVMASVINEGEQYEASARLNLGDQSKLIYMVADAYGREKASHDALIGKLAAKR